MRNQMTLLRKGLMISSRKQEGDDMGLDMHSLLSDMSEAWQRANVPTKHNPTNNRSKCTNRNRNKMSRRAIKDERSFRSIQTKWKANKRSAIRSVLDGTDEAKCGIPVKEVQEVYKGRFEQVSRTVDLGGFPSPKRRIETSDLQGLREPITPEEVRSALKSTKAMTAAGPDGVAACQLKAKAGDGELLATVFNTWLTEQRIPQYLKESRSILLPKGKKDLNLIGNWRPLTISSILLRIYSKVLAKRLTAAVPLNPIQRGFIPAPGVGENTQLLARVIKQAKARKGELAVAFLDLAKAFDTVSHDLVRKGMKRFGIPDFLVNVVADMYEGAITTFTVTGGQTEPIAIGSGVKQGDPLSPILFDMALDPLLCLLETEGEPWKIGRTNLTAMGYADDTAVMSRSRAGLETNLELVDSFCQQVGLKLNVRKSFVFHLKATGKTFTVNNCEQYSINGEPIPWVAPDEATKYLGKQFGPWVGLERPQLFEQLKLWDERVKNAPLKPMQRLEIWRGTIVPRIFSAMLGTGATQGYLRELDNTIRLAVKRVLHLPDQITNHLFYTPIKNGGLGFMELESHVPRCDGKTINKLVHSKDSYISRLASSLKLEEVPREVTSDPKRKHVTAWMDQKTQGLGVSTWADEPNCNFWLKGNTFSSGELTTAIKVRTNTYPTRECIGRSGGGAAADIKCRRCGLTTETLGHISGACIAMKKARIKRHESICQVLAKKCTAIGWKVHWEPSFNINNVLLRPDLVMVKDNRIVLVDPTVVFDGTVEALAKANKTKLDKYSCLKQYLIARFGDAEDDLKVSIFGLPIGARGGWLRNNDAVIHALGLHRPSTIKALSIRALGGTLRLLQIFSDGF
ncbi:hypothetical protein ACOMHN_055483 [Nucella lapillus]